MSIIDNLGWRYATKRFDPSKKVEPADLERLKEAIRLAPSSYGLQAYKVLIISDSALREKLRPSSWNQSQITDSSHLFVFCHYTNITQHQLEDYYLKIKSPHSSLADAAPWVDFVMGKLSKKSSEERFHWLARQPYIALGVLLATCAELRIDACPMEGFEPEEYANVLQLKERGLYPSVVVAVGFRSAEDPAQQIGKTRQPSEQLFEQI